MAPLRIGFVGAGRMGNHHANKLSGLADRAVITAIDDVDTEKTNQLASRTDARPYIDYRAMLKREPLDAVFILTQPTVCLLPVQIACEKKSLYFARNHLH